VQASAVKADNIPQASPSAIAFLNRLFNERIAGPPTRLRPNDKNMSPADVKKRFIKLAADTLGSTPEELTAYNRSEIAK
jgi:hypothetical protein